MEEAIVSLIGAYKGSCHGEEMFFGVELDDLGRSDDPPKLCLVRHP